MTHGIVDANAQRAVDKSGTAGNLTNDAHLAALAVEHGARVCTFDRDFARFAGITLVIPEG
jgi:predicted nucleic acid-binding protein